MPAPDLEPLLAWGQSVGLTGEPGHVSLRPWSTTAHLFLAHELSPHAAAADSTEELEVRTVPFGDAPAMVLSGEIVDAMTIIAILWADRAAHP